MEGNSLLYAALKILVFGRFLPSGGYDVMLHSIAFAGWAGLLVTGLNLIPAGQLDGGHIIYALLGERARYLTIAIIIALLGLSWLWRGWLIWAFLIFIFSRAQATPLDDITSLTPSQRLVAIGMMILFVLVYVPVPITIH
jgi:membrane-associated protease RseP (regulator of RpoE activity)